jgi:hypothetical protein
MINLLLLKLKGSDIIDLKKYCIHINNYYNWTIFIYT